MQARELPSAPLIHSQGSATATGPVKQNPTAALASHAQLEYLYTSLFARPNIFVYFCEAIMENATENVWHLLN